MKKAPKGEYLAMIENLEPGTYFLYGGDIHMKMDKFTSGGMEFKSILSNGKPGLCVQIGPNNPSEWDCEITALDRIEALARLLKEVRRK